MATVRGHYRFTVKEWGDGKPWIAAEPAGDIIPGMGDLGFDLDHGTTVEQAHALAHRDEQQNLGGTHQRADEQSRRPIVVASTP